MTYRSAAVLLSLLLFLPFSAFAAPDSKKKAKVVIVAGAPSHGYGAHEFNAGSLLIQKLFKESTPNLEVVVHKSGWPKEEEAFEGADAIVLFMDGGGRHPVNKHLDQIGPLMDKGVGLMCMHYAVEVPVGPTAKGFLNWIGGYYESGFSINPHWVAKSKLNREHPISNGVEDFAVNDEWYFNMRFREKMDGVTSVLKAVPDDEARSGKTSWPRGPRKDIVDASGREETLLWATEREDGGRGVGFTGAHFHWNFGDDGFRKLVLNSIVWVAGLEVPEGGIETKKPTRAELEENQDFPKPEEKKPAKKKSKEAKSK